MTGSDTAGAYHAGVLRALREAGVKIDLVAGRGVGVVGAMFSAVDGGTTLWQAGGVWRSSGTRQLYAWRKTLKAAAWTLVVALSALLVPLMAVVGAAVVYPIGFVLRLSGLGLGDRLALGYTRLVELAFQTDALPLVLPRFVMVALLILLCILAIGEAAPRIRRRRRRARGLVWWRLLGAPLEVSRVIDHFTDGLWTIMRGAARIPKPGLRDLAERYADLLSENVGQPGFGELIVIVHDLDTRRDLAFGLLSERHGRPFFVRRLGGEGSGRYLETMDLAGSARVHAVDALAASLSLPVVTDAHLIRFTSESGWRGETHRLCDRPEATTRLLEEVANAGAEQVILVTALPEPDGPHALTSSRRDPRARVGEYLAAAETAAVRDAVARWGSAFQAVFQIRPLHNPLGPFDFDGGYDEQSDRPFALAELVERGREDGFRQFVDAVVGASGEWLEPKSRSGSARPAAGDSVATSASDL